MSMPGPTAVPVLLAAAGATWEAAAVERLDRRGAGTVLRRRCVDLPDLLAAARTGLSPVAVVAEGLPGLDVDSVSVLRGAGVQVVAVVDATGDRTDAEARLRRLGVVRSLGSDLEGLEEAVRAAAEGPTRELPEAGAPDADDAEAAFSNGTGGRLVAVWGPAGAPGRTTLAVSVAAELADRGLTTLLVDADPYGGAVAQHLGVLDEVSGLLAAARTANAGRLDAAALAQLCRSVGDGMRVLTGLPRADRWVEVRPAAFEELLRQARHLADRVVVDLGFSLEEDGDPFAAAPRRNGLTLDVLEQADELLVVGSADPVGLARLARGLVEVAERCPGLATVVVVNRARPSLGWAEQDVRGMVEGFHRHARVRFVPEDRETADRALMAGRSVVELGDSPLRRSVSAVVDSLAGTTTRGSESRSGRGLRSRRAGRAR
jgi:MinD-like ATPase involved in chromosome partitioning or flagellar assembly